MEITSLFGFAIISLFLYSVLRQYNQSYAILLSVVCCIILIIYASNTLEPIFTLIQNLAQYTQTGDFSVVFKAVAIAVLSQFTSDLCKESGQLALSGSVEFVGKVAIILVSLPLLLTLTDIILELLQ